MLFEGFFGGVNQAVELVALFDDFATLLVLRSVLFCFVHHAVTSVSEGLNLR